MTQPQGQDQARYRVSKLVQKANQLLERSFQVICGFSVVKRAKMEAILDELIATFPEDLKEAERLLKRKDDMMYDAQNRADRIVMEAQNEANRLLSESELLKAVQAEADRIKEQVLSECEELRARTIEEVSNVKHAAIEEAIKIREGADTYAEQVLGNLEQDLDQLQQIVKNGQNYLEQMRQDSTSSAIYSGSRNSQSVRNDYETEYVEM